MPEFQLLRCEVALAGDLGNTVVRGRGNPITYPELEIIQFIHGEDAVWDIHVIGTCQMSNDDMLARLRFLYREDDFKAVFTGAKPRLTPGDPNLPICTLPITVAPPTTPDSPDPKLKPLNSYVTRDVIDRPVVIADPVVLEDDPTPDEIAAHAQEDDDPTEDFGLGTPLGAVVMPQVEDQLRTPENISGKLNNLTKPAYLPDVASRPRPRTKIDPDRPRG